MKRILGVIALLIAMINLPTQLHAQGKIGFGAILNTQGPLGVSQSGISFRGNLANNLSINAATSFTLGNNANTFYLQGDIILSDSIEGLDLEEELDLEFGALTPYFGAGLRARLGNRNNIFGVRTPVGIRYVLGDQPFDLFIELVPTFDIEPQFLFSFGGGLGFRYYIL